MAINSLNASSRGFSGLVSGMDTQSMVEKMLSGTQVKIDKAGQKKTTLQYKQQLYRDVATKLRTLQSSFLSFTSKTNLLSNGFYNTMSATVNPPSGTSAAFSVTASSSAKLGSATMDYIQQLATAGSYTTSLKSGGSIDAVLSSKAAETLVNKYVDTPEGTLTIKVGSKSVAIANAPKELGGLGNNALADFLNTQFQSAGVEAEARFVNNKLSIIANNPEDTISLQGYTGSDSKDSTLAMRMFGSVSSLSGKGTLTTAVDTDKYLPNFKVSLDGREQSVNLNLSKLEQYARATDETARQTALNGLLDDIGGQLTAAFGSGVSLVKLDAQGVAEGQSGFDAGSIAGFTLKTGSESQKVTITGDSSAMGILGLKSGISNKLNTDMALRDLNFTTGLQGSLHKFTINGVEFAYTDKVALSTIIGDINNSKAGVKISYNESKNQFVMETRETGKGTGGNIEIGDVEGNLMSALFGTKGSGVATGNSIGKTLVGADLQADDLAAIRDGGRFSFMVNGTKRTFNVVRKEGDDPITPEKLAEKLNEAFATSFGKNAEGEQNVTFAYKDGHFEINSLNKDNVISIMGVEKDVNKSQLGFALHDSTQVTTKDTTLAQAGIDFGAGADTGALKVTIDGAAASVDMSRFHSGMTMAEFAAELESQLKTQGVAADPSKFSITFDEKSAAFRVAGVDVPMEIAIEEGDASTGLQNLFGGSSLKMGQVYADVEIKQTEGQNAIFSLNGTEMERSSNTFTVDGLTFTLNTTTALRDDYVPVLDPDDPTGTSYLPPAAKDYVGATSIAVNRDTDKIVEGIREFLALYNETIDFINDLYKADPTYKDYAPLTAEQKQEMSDREIELWEEKSKEGLLRGDQNLAKVLQSLREAMYTKPEGSGIAIYDLGISTSFYAKDGNLQEENNNDLKALIEADPEAVRLLFAGTGGVMETLDKAITNATYTSYGSPGYLVAVAGSNTGDTNSSIYKQIKEIDDQLSTLEDRYWNEYNRYWKQFNAMEQMIQQMNQQSSWLTQQFSS